MEQLTETITLDMEEANELAFKIQVEGATTPAKVRLVCESGDVSYMFNGKGTSEDGVVQFVIPQMKEKLQEGTYSSRVEVLIENRYFSPVQFQINFKKTMKVFAESISIPRYSKPEIKVSAAPMVVQQKQVSSIPSVKPITIETPVVATQTAKTVNEQEYVLSQPEPIAQVQKESIQKQQVAQQPQQALSGGLTLREKFMKQLLKQK